MDYSELNHKKKTAINLFSSSVMYKSNLGQISTSNFEQRGKVQTASRQHNNQRVRNTPAWTESLSA